jgi:hypothetical protein
MGSTTTPLLDAQQLLRIEGVHRGFLYQHLYAVAWLLSAQSVGANSIVVERDEDLEIVFPNRRFYVQVKTRSASLTSSDIESAVQRFDALRLEHEARRRHGSASFVVAANVAPGPALLARLKSDDWPADVTVHWPDNPGHVDKVLPALRPDIAAALGQCAELAASLPYALLAPETLVWKLAGCVMAAAAGNPPRADHAFQTAELPNLFEQVVIQLQDFPAPPFVYRSHSDEPPLQSSERVRIVTGYSGSGKTSWVSQAAVHATDTVTYFDVTETPGPALASALARELAARLFGRTGGQLGEILLPGATGPEILCTIGTRLAESGQDATIVLDNAHRIPPADIQTLVQQGSKLKFLLLCQPGRHVQELEVRLSITAEPLRGWASDTIALEVANRKCRGDYAACQRLANLTAGMPLYVQNAIAITAAEYDGSISRFCDDLEAKTHAIETAQELILTHVFDALPVANRDGIGVLSLSDIPLARTDAKRLLMNLLGLEEKAVAILLRQLRSSGCMEVFGGDRLKIHDSMRLLGQAHLERLGDVHRARAVLKDILAKSLQQQWEMPKLSLYLRMLAAVGDIKTLVQLVTDELFHELGIQPEIMAFLDKAAASEVNEPEDRFWALDGLVFADVKHGNYGKASERQEVMARLIADHKLGVDEFLALSMKRMNLLAVKGDADAVLALISEISELLPETHMHQRIFRYNAAHALFSLGRHEAAIAETSELIQEYYDVLGIGPEDVLGRNSDKIRPLLKESPDLPDHLKHLADCLDLHATVMNAAGRASPFGRIHAMKFYQLAKALDSLIRVGQDLVDEFVERNDFIGARQMIETNLLPNVLRLKMLARVIPVRSQYAVVLAYCGDFDAAEAEMQRLAPYEAGLDEKGQWELRNQRKGIAELRLKRPPPQWIPPSSRTATIQGRKVGRNAPCPCGSGKKYKKCHGLNT